MRVDSGAIDCASPGGVAQKRKSDDGIAMILALVVTTVVLALGMAALALTDVEIVGAGSRQDGAQVLYAADAGLECVMDELSLAPDWSPGLSGAIQSRVSDATLQPTTVLAGQLDLATLTANLQTESDARNRWGPNGPRWRLFAYGRLEDFISGASPPQPYVAVWLADDEAETDGNPFVDDNGYIRLHVMAFGARGARRIVEALIARMPATNRTRLMGWWDVR